MAVKCCKQTTDCSIVVSNVFAVTGIEYDIGKYLNNMFFLDIG